MLMTAPLITRGSWPGGREVWLEEKGALDRERLGFRKDLWCVRDKVYDLSDYLSRHPGGDGETSTACHTTLRGALGTRSITFQIMGSLVVATDWLTMTRGHDVTDLVETHHLEQSKVEVRM